MKAIIYKINGIDLDLNGEILYNVREKISHPESYVKHEFGCFYFMYLQPNGVWSYSYFCTTKSEMHAYLCGLLNF